MKNAIIDEILYNETSKKLEELNEELRLMYEQSLKLEKTLLENLSTEALKLFADYCKLSDFCHGEESERYFAEGFSCALRICFECLK